jgi:nucleoside-diphosphate-sugar epimerase
VDVTVTGGAGYVGALVVDELLSAGHRVRAVDVLLHDQDDVAASLERAGAEVVRGDVRDPATRAAAVNGSEAVVHLAAIVGDPACARDPEASTEINVNASRALAVEAADAGVQRFVFASTCSNYGRMADPSVPIDESGTLAPVSLYAEQKVSVERALLETERDSFSPTCLRFATVYGVAPRMRFDLTVNEFTRDLWADRPLEVFGEQFWRPYVHVRDAARAVAMVLAAPLHDVRREVYNVGHSDENYRKLDLVELITGKLGRGDVSYVRRDEDPRDYKVSFEKVRERLGFEPGFRVPTGIDELIAALDERRFGDPFGARFSNIPVPSR